MLILNRKLGESIMIGDDIEIIVTEIHRHMVKLGFIARKDMKILRKELWLAVQPVSDDKLTNVDDDTRTIR